MTDRARELLPCPFCGGHPHTDCSGPNEYDIECYCGAGVIICGPTANTIEAAAEAWNRRALLDTSRAVDEPTDRVERLLDELYADGSPMDAYSLAAALKRCGFVLGRAVDEPTEVERVARAMCGRDLEWRDCERACLAAGKCVGNLSDCVIEDARAAIAAMRAAQGERGAETP